MIKIACVLKVSKEYTVEYVERLAEAISQNVTVDHELICLSDVNVPCTRIPLEKDWPGWWCKLELFRPDIKGDLFYLDLDTMLVGNIDDIISTTKLTMLSDFYRTKNLASGLMFLPEESRKIIWRYFVKNPTYWMRQYRVHGDQAFLAKMWDRRTYSATPQRWQDLFPDRVVSYKTHVLKNRNPERPIVNKGTVPAEASIICFHGYPRPHHINWNLT